MKYYITVRETHHHRYMPYGSIHVWEPSVTTFSVLKDMTPAAYIASLYIRDLEQDRVTKNTFVRKIEYSIQFAYQVTDEEAEEIEARNEEYEALKKAKEDAETQARLQRRQREIDAKALKKANRWYRRLWRVVYGEPGPALY